jgi:hypothetical protein
MKHTASVGQCSFQETGCLVIFNTRNAQIAAEAMIPDVGAQREPMAVITPHPHGTLPGSWQPSSQIVSSENNTAK